jgi:single-stranded-DNA-specific exonuclease
MDNNHWILPHLPDPDVVRQLADALLIDPVLAQLLVQRGVHTFEEAKSFFRPQYSDLHDPFLMRDMDKAVARLTQALAEQQKIMIYGDYDVDGTTAVALVYSFLKTYGADVIHNLPDRNRDGYGVSYRSIDYAESEGVKLIVALDCGIKATEKVKYAAAKGIDYIICDHHLPDSTPPPAVAVLDPQCEDSGYPCKHLSGCGVGFKLMQAFCQKNDIPLERILPYLDLVAVSIASDIVPITGENRTLAYYGLQQLNSNPRKGLRTLINLADLNGSPVTINDIVFRIGPRINAAGRMESGATAVDLLLADSDSAAQNIGFTVNQYNINRKNIDRSITAEAIAAIKNEAQWQYKYSIVSYNPHWHKGVLGIVASRLTEEFYRPAIVLTESNGMATGSARSIAGFDLYAAIEQCAPLLTNFGGHVHAAGLTLPIENVAKFAEMMENIARQVLTPEMLVPQIEIDAEIDFKSITPKFCRILKQFAPFGPGNMSPMFVTRGVFGCNPRVVGNPPKHLKVELIQQDTAGSPFAAIGFGLAHHYPHIKAGNPFDVCYSIRENTYQGKTTLQLNICDIRYGRGEAP